MSAYSEKIKGIKFYILDLGVIWEDSNNLCTNSTYATSVDKEAKNNFVPIPVWCALIWHPELGWVLFDTGAHADGINNGFYPESIMVPFPYYNDKEQTLLNRLAEVGVKPEDINTIILSHFHWDHAGGLEFFPHATVYCSKDDFDAAAEMLFESQPAVNAKAYMKADFLAPNKKRIYVKKDFELAEGMDIINLPGHVAGILGLVLHLESGTYMFPSDALNCRLNFGPPAQGAGQMADSKAFFESVEKAREVQKKYNATILYSHDMEYYKTLKKAPEYYI